MNIKKTIARIKLVLINIVKQVLGQVLNLVLSVFIFKYYSKELWGEFSAYFLYIGMATLFLSWGNKDFLIREFSKTPHKIAERFYVAFNARLLLLFPLILMVILVNPANSLFFILWIVSAFVSQSLEVFWIFKRDYFKSVLIEIGAFFFLIAVLYFNTVTPQKLIEYYAYYQFLKATAYVFIYLNELKPFRFVVEKKYFRWTASFFVLSLIGFLQSRADFIMITFFETKQNIAIYQVISTYFILIHALGTFLIFPYIKNIYRLDAQAVTRFQKKIALFSPIIVSICLLGFFLILTYIYDIKLNFFYYALGFLIALPPYLYTIKILVLYKENKQHLVLRIGIIGIIANSFFSFVFLYLGYGLPGALMGSAIAQIFTAYQYTAYFSDRNIVFSKKQHHAD